MITRLDKVTVYVESQEEAKKFWIDQVGFRLTYEQQMGPIRWIEVSPPGDNLTSLVLYSKPAMMQQNPAMVAHPSLIFASENVEATWKAMKANGVSVDDVQSMPYGRMFSFKDGDGNRYMVRG